jgi:hypothetical protein
MRIGEIERVGEREIPMPALTPPKPAPPAPERPAPRRLTASSRASIRPGVSPWIALRRAEWRGVVRKDPCRRWLPVPIPAKTYQALACKTRLLVGFSWGFCFNYKNTSTISG